jgi:hypothetical protein
MNKLVFICLSILIGNKLHAQAIEGSWKWEDSNSKHLTELNFNHDGNHVYSGYYCSVFNDGEKIDCSYDISEVCISVSQTGANVYTGTFQSPAFDGHGNLKITFSPSIGKIKLEITDGLGEFYLPKDALFEKF